MGSPFKRRLGAATAATLMAATGTVGGVALAVLGAGSASAAYPGPTKVTYNNNACQTALAPPGTFFDSPLSLGSDQSYPGIAVGVDAAGVPLPGGVSVAAAGPTGAGLTPTAGVLQGGSGTLTNVGADAFLAASLVGAGVGGGFITIGQTVPATFTITINAYGGATFPAGQPAGVSVVSPTQVKVTGSGTGIVPDPALGQPLDLQIVLPNVNYTAPNDPNANIYFAQDAPGTLATPPSATSNSAVAAANLGFPQPVTLNCLPGAGTPAWAPTAQSAIRVFAAVDVQPALPPTLVPQTVASVNLNGQVSINTLAGATANVPITSVQVVTPPLYGTVTIDNNPASPTFGRATYTNTGGGAGLGDSFTVTASTSAGPSAPVTETISQIIAFAPSCNASAPGPTCHLDQIVVVPVFGADLTMSQSSGLPLDVLGGVVGAAGCEQRPMILNGQPQFACGAMWPVTVNNSRGTDAGWELTGQVTDFLDSTVPPTTTCSTTATYSNHCIPGGNLSWIPVAGVAHGLVPGDVAKVDPGAAILNLGVTPPSLANTAALSNTAAGPFGVGAGQAIAAYDGLPGQPAGSLATQPNPVVPRAPYAGLHDAAQTLCISPVARSGGTFICGAALIVAVPASAAQAPFDPTTGLGGYRAQLTLTLA